MKTLKYTIIKGSEQYNEYCNKLEELVSIDEEQYEDEIELLILLIEKYDNENAFFEKLNPIETIKSLMKDHKIKAKELAKILDLSTGTVSKILNYQKGLSKETIRKLASHFKMQQEAFNRSYKLINPVNRLYKNASLMNTEKDINTINYSRVYNY
jgi:HTH-type transcriptional regulator/antitoxin HigA